MTQEAIDVLFVVTALGSGGTERYVEDLAIALSELGACVAVLVHGGSMLRLHSLTAAGIPVHCLEINASCSREQYEERVSKVLQAHPVRVIHANVWEFEDWLRGLARRAGIPFVTTGHHTVPPVRLRDRLGLNRIPFAMYRRRRLMRQGNAGTICISDMSLRNHRARYGPQARAVRVYCGRPAGKDGCEPRGDGSSPRIGWLGSMIPRKRPLLAIQAFSVLLGQLPECSLVMGGSGELDAVVREEAEKLSGKVSLPGYVGDVPRLLSSCDIFLQTAVNEGTPLVILEAMAAGLPVVATDAGATRELVSHETTGILVPLDNVAALASALTLLASDPDLRSRYGNAARRSFEDRFSHSRMVRETIAAYKQLVGVDVLSHAGSPSIRTVTRPKMAGAVLAVDKQASREASGEVSR